MLTRRTLLAVGGLTAVGWVVEPAVPASADSAAVQTFAMTSRPAAATILGDSLHVSTLQLGDLNGRAAAAGLDILSDARSGRPLVTEGWDHLQDQALYGALAPVVVIALGTNDVPYWPPATFRAYLERCVTVVGGRRLILVDIWRRDGYAQQALALNQQMYQCATSHPNVTAAHWSDLAARNPAWLSSDGIHYYPAGYVARAQFLIERIQAS